MTSFGDSSINNSLQGGFNKSMSKSMKDESVKFHASDFLTLKQEHLLAEYKLGKVLGEGGFGLVYSCKHKETGAERAVKVLQKDPSRPAIQDNIINEFNVLKDLDHPNLVKVYDLYQDDECFFIVTDLYSGGDVFDILEDQGPLKEEDAAVVMNNLLGCVNYFHKRNLIHRDLKPENILLDKKKEFSDIKVIDFGLARYTECFGDELKGLVGSAYYVSPQVIEGDYTNLCDVWSCGVIAYALLSGFAPFDASTDGAVLEMVYDGRYDFEDPEWDGISELAKDFIAQLLNYDEDERPSAGQALQHPWLKRCRRSPRMNNALIRANSRSSLKDLSKFTSKSNKLKQAACAMISSQLLVATEKEMIDKAFRALDKSCNGQITKKDLNSSFVDLFGDDSSSDDSSSSEDEDDMNKSNDTGGDNSCADLVDSIFEQVNFSGSGAIQYSEFAIVMMLEKNMVDDGKLKAAFKFFDPDDKGFIGRDDLKAILKTGNQASKRIMDSTASNKKRDKIKFADFKKCILPEVEEKKDEPEEEGFGSGRFKGKKLGGPMDDSSRRRRVEEGSARKTAMDESSRRHKLSRKTRGGGINGRVSSVVPGGATNLEKLEELKE